MFEPKCPVDPKEYMDLHMDMLKLIQYEQIKSCDLAKNVIDILMRLNWHCVTLTQSCMELIWPGFVWQAEILVRSLLEATIKLIYITIDKLNIDQKIDEFQNIISDINQYKRRKEIIELLDGVNFHNDVAEHAYQKIIDDDVEMKLNQNERKKIIERWTFNSMTQEIDSYKIENFDKLKYFKNYYSSTSHYTHVDIDCLNIIQDCDKRGEKENEALTLAHMGRELKDIYLFNVMRTYSLLRLFNIDKFILPEYIKSKKNIIEKIDSLSKEWDSFYREQYLDDNVGVIHDHE
jgi:hypothetical protein